MEGGTHAEAVKAGFTSEQAVFFTRACIEIKNECWQHFEKELNERNSRTKDIFLKAMVRFIPFVIVFGIGLFIGSLIVTN